MIEEPTQALLLAQHDHFDLDDYYLPDYSGVDFVILLRDFDGYRHVPAVLLTGRPEELDRKRLCDELPLLLLSKPYPTVQLVDAVSKRLAISFNS